MDLSKKSLSVHTAQIHQAMNVFRGITSTTLNTTKYPGIQMNIVPLGLAVEYKGQTGIVPSANVIVALLNKESD